MLLHTFSEQHELVVDTGLKRQPAVDGSIAVNQLHEPAVSVQLDADYRAVVDAVDEKYGQVLLSKMRQKS